MSAVVDYIDKMKSNNRLMVDSNMLYVGGDPYSMIINKGITALSNPDGQDVIDARNHITNEITYLFRDLFGYNPKEMYLHWEKKGNRATNAERKVIDDWWKVLNSFKLGDDGASYDRLKDRQFSFDGFKRLFGHYKKALEDLEPALHQFLRDYNLLDAAPGAAPGAPAQQQIEEKKPVVLSSFDLRSTGIISTGRDISNMRVVAPSAQNAVLTNKIDSPGPSSGATLAALGSGNSGAAGTAQKPDQKVIIIGVVIVAIVIVFILLK